MSFFQIVFKLISIVLICSVFSFQQSTRNDDSLKTLKKIQLEVLEKNAIGKEFEYNLTGQKECNKTKLTYLGMVTTKNRRKYKLLNSFWVTGYSCKGISQLVVYDTNNVYLGHYKFDLPEDLPTKLINNELVFKTENIKISFRYGLPKKIMVFENTYYFESN